MQDEQILLSLLESVLGKSKITSRNNRSFLCPNNCHPSKHKLEINLNTGKYQCWICGREKDGFQGKHIKSLLIKLKVNKSKIQQLDLIELSKPNVIKHNLITLPDEFISLKDTSNLNIIQKIYAKHAITFLNKRNITYNHILKYNIGFCGEGKYSNRVIIPSYDTNGDLNYFIARSFEEDPKKKYNNPIVPKDNIIGLEYFINWEAPIILVEGIFDAITIQRNAIPLFGKTLSDTLIKKIILSDTEKVYIGLDADAQKEALEHCETLMNYGKEVYLIEMEEKDISELGFEKSLKLLENTYPLTFKKIISIKLKL
jgi:hypothetical protein